MKQINRVYIFIRTDLPIQHQIIQACHSVLEAGRTFSEHHGVSHIVLIAVESQTELLEIKSYLIDNEVNHRIFYEPDNDYQYTSITTEPIYGSKRNIFKHFKLYKGETNERT